MNNRNEVVMGSEESPTSEVKSAVKVGKPRGFAAMSRDDVRKIAAKGGKAVAARGTGHRFTKEQAAEAGRKGGLAPHSRRGRNPVSESK